MAMTLEEGVIHAGDCMDLLPEVADGSVQLVFCDPPFNTGYEYDRYKDNRDAQEYIDWCARWGAELVRVLSPTGSLWLAIGDEYAAELKILFHRTLGLHPRNWVVWHVTFGVACQTKFSRTHVHLHHFIKDPKRHTFNADDVRVASARQTTYGDKRANSKGKLPDDVWALRPQDAPGMFAPDQDTWAISRVCGTFKERAGFHGCQMPEAVLERIIRVSSNPGDLVLDNMAGSGTACAVAKRLGRRFIGMELSPDYAAGAQARVDAVRAEEVAVAHL